ncbi:hypothetical protein FRC12_003528 [Ceratobasidium sp. 428]|nr:hypothetical protein FRC12_003528 [Ceratobasidium sp. 428]
MGSFVSNLSTLLGVPAMGERLDSISLRSFLDVYPGPAFILGTNGLSHTNPTLIYGNLALQSLVSGEGNHAVLDDAAFFNAICDTSIFQRLYDPTYPTTNTLNGSRDAWSIDLRPPWLTHESDPLRLEFTATPILPPRDHPTNRLFVYTALPAQASSALSPRGIDSATQEIEPVPGRSPSRGSDSLLYTFPWETTTLGPRAEWPESLKTMVRYIMATNIPTAIYWGWPDLIMIYNNAYAALAGSKHPSIYGQKASVAWGDQWDRANSIAELCKHGRSTWRTDDPLFFTSFTEFGNPREVYHTWHWTPIGQEDGSVGGILNSTYDTTRKVIAERRVQCLTDLISWLSEAKTHDEVLQVVLAVLSEHAIDFPFAALYVCSSSDTRVRRYLKGDSSRRQKALTVPVKLMKAKLNLAGVVGIPDNHPAAPRSVEYVLNPATLQLHQNRSKSSPDSHERDSPIIIPTTASPSDPSTPSTDDKKLEDPHIDNPWPFLALFSSGKTQIISSLPDSLTEGLPKCSFGNVTNSAALLPIPIDFPGKNDGPALPHAVLVLGLNTRLSYDESYAKWLESIAAAFTSRLIAVLQMEVDAELARERARLDAAQSKFFMGVSHELRSPLTLVQAPLEQLAESRDLAPAVKSRVDLAVRNVARLRRLIESVLDVSKLEAGHITGHFRPVHLNEITESLTSLFRGVAETRGIEMHLETQPQDYDAKPSTYLDIQLWEKMFCNLLTNAFKYTRAGRVTVLVSYDPTSAYLRVCDTGIGIPAAKQGEIFELFHRINDLPVQGSGIGLAVAKDLVSLHGGKLSVSSRAESEYTDNTGSIFTVEIPLGCDHLAPERVDERTVSPSDLIFGQSKYWMELDTPTKIVETNENDSISTPMFFKKSDIILIVDNDPDMRSFIGSVFAPHMTVFEARDGLEALEVARSNNVDLILRQVHAFLFPFTTLTCLEKKTMFIPVIFVTAALDNTEFFAGEADGIVDCVTKPFSIRDLLARSHLQLQIGKRRIKLENDFTERSSELHTLMNLSPVGIFRTDTFGRLTYTNPRWHQVTGYDATRDQDRWMDHIYSESQADAVQAWRACLVDGKSSSTRVQWVGGAWTQFDITPLVTPEGDYLGALGTITDITNLHRLKETRVALAEEREQAAAARALDAEIQRRAEVERRKAQGIYATLATVIISP